MDSKNDVADGSRACGCYAGLVALLREFPPNEDEAGRAADAIRELVSLLNLVWRCMNEDCPPDFPMKEIERVIGR